MIAWAVDPGPNLTDMFSWLARACAIGAFGFCWRMQTRMTKIETWLKDEDLGIMPRVTELRKHSHATNQKLQDYGARIELLHEDVVALKHPRKRGT